MRDDEGEGKGESACDDIWFTVPLQGQMANYGCERATPILPAELFVSLEFDSSSVEGIYRLWRG